MSETSLEKADEEYLAKIEPEDEEEIVLPVRDEVFLQLKVKQQKYVQLLVSTSLTTGEIAAKLKVSKRQLTRWSKDPLVKKFINAWRKKALEDDVSHLKAQHRSLIDKAYVDLAGRYDKADVDRDLGPDPSPSDVAMYKATKAEFAKFSDSSKAYQLLTTGFMNVNKMENTGGGSEDEFVGTIRKTYRKKIKKQKAYQEHLANKGLGGKNFAELVSENAVAFTDDVKLSNTLDYEEIEEVSVEEFSIVKKKEE